jgi:ubiquinone/menaquinone biosynthesis C-methylase UbiE
MDFIRKFGRSYDRWVLPTLINLAMRREEATRLRAAHVPAAVGVVMEVGIGSGLNLPFYTSAVTHLFGVDPSPELLAMAREKAAAVQFPVELFNCSADRIPLGDSSVDTVVVTWSLCSIARAEDALREMRRVLKPGGTFIFVEHGLSPDGSVRKWQNRLTPFWGVFTGGCHLNRKMDDLVRGAGFTIADLRMEYVPGPRALAFTYEGRARKIENRK